MPRERSNLGICLTWVHFPERIQCTQKGLSFSCTEGKPRKEPVSFSVLDGMPASWHHHILLWFPSHIGWGSSLCASQCWTRNGETNKLYHSFGGVMGINFPVPTLSLHHPQQKRQNSVQFAAGLSCSFSHNTYQDPD